jgi:hypothetical protein
LLLSRILTTSQIYNHALSIPDKRSDRALRIERRNLKHFRPSAAALLLILHHEYFLLNRQIALEALEALFKHHSVFLSCGPFVLKSLLEAVEQHPPGAQWLSWLKAIELDWVTFPDLRMYPPERTHGRDEWWFEAAAAEDGVEVDVDYVRGAAYSSHYDEHDYTGNYYDDNFYDPADAALYPSYTHHAPVVNPNAAADDLSTLFDHNPFPDAEEAYQPAAPTDDLTTKLSLLVEMEVSPLFAYLSSPSFPALTTLTLPLYFISRDSFAHRRASRPAYTLPLKVRFWAHVVAHALAMLVQTSSSLARVRVRYMPWDIWASMDSCDDLSRIVKQGVWFDDEVRDGPGGEREDEGEAFRCVWGLLGESGVDVGRTGGKGKGRMGLQAGIRVVKWDGEMDSYRVGDELEVVFTKGSSQDEHALL